MKTWMVLATLILAPMTAAAFDLPWSRAEAALDENARRRILQQIAVYQDSSLDPIKTAVKEAKTETELTSARTRFESWKIAGIQKRSADSSRVRMKSYFESQTSLVRALRTYAPSSGWSYFDGAKAAASSQEVEAELPVASVRYNYAKVSGIAMSQGAKAEIVKAAIEEATLQGVDPNLVLAIIQKESGYNPHAVGSSGEIGLMQLMPSTACDRGVCDSNKLFDYRTNIRAGIKQLRWLSDFFNVSLKDMRQVSDNGKRAVVAAYNAGKGTVQRWRRQSGENFQIRFPTTHRYVNDVLDTLSALLW